ncbi:MAG: hypothetical protein IK136_04635 [Oscillospiraceae bacterium]|nr:hypothetical protein [Oscillospiraceae bacterium]
MLLVLTITAAAILLSSCAVGGNTESAAQAVRRTFSEAESVRMNMTLTADYGEKVYEFKVRWTGTEENGRLEVLSPESVAGLTAVLDERGGRLIYDGAAFETGGLFGDGLSPAEAAPLMLGAWKSGYAVERSSESVDGEKTAALTYELSGGDRLKTWFDAETLLPLRAEITENGFAVLTAEFGDVKLE